MAIPLFYHKKTNDFEFELREDKTTREMCDKEQKVSSCLDDNITYAENALTADINNDIVRRRITFEAGGRSIDAYLIYVEGLTSSTSINETILLPLMRMGDRCLSQDIDIEYILNRMLPQGQVTVSDRIYDMTQSVNIGNVIIFFDGFSSGAVIEVKSWEHRSIGSPSTEQVIQGPQEGFNEVMRCNTALVRKGLNNNSFIARNVTLGKTSKTPGALMYLSDVANSNLVDEVLRRIENIDCEYVLTALDVEQYIEEASYLPIPQIITTERPDRVCRSLVEGRVALTVNGSSHVLIMPATLFDLASSVEDEYLRYPYSALIRLVRLMAVVISMLGPGLFVAAVSYHQDLILTDLFLSIQASRLSVPFSVLFELLIMELSFELIREAGIRIPGHIGSTLGIVGGLILGTAAVDANIVSPAMIIVVAITGISSFAIPSYSLSFSFRFSRFIYVAGSALCGFPGLCAVFFVNTVMYMGTQSFGVPYLSPVAPYNKSKSEGLLFRKPLWKQDERPEYLKPRDNSDKAHISRKWLYKRR